MSTEKCPHCGGEYKRLSVHLIYCKENPENWETLPTLDEETTISGDGGESYDFTVLLEPIDEYIDDPIIPEHECPYLVIIAGNACANCRGASCMASKDKKISDTDYCKYEWPDCLVYIDAVDRGVRTVCPYYGLPPPDKPNCCSGQYCYAKMSAVKVAKACLHWTDCTTYLMSKYEGKPFHRRKL